MEEETKAKVVSMFAEMKVANRNGARRESRKSASLNTSGTKIINSTIVVCGDGWQEVVAKLLREKRRSRSVV